MSKLNLLWFGAGALLLSTASCQGTGSRGSSVYVCLKEMTDYNKFVTLFKESGEKIGLKFEDASKDTARWVESTAKGGTVYNGTPLNIGLIGEGDTSVLVGNLGLPILQIGMGFPEDAEGDRLKKIILGDLRKHYDIRVPADGQTITSNDTCN